MKTTSLSDWKIWDQQTQFIGSPERDVDHLRSISNNLRAVGDAVVEALDPTDKKDWYDTPGKRVGAEIGDVLRAPFSVAKDVADMVLHAAFAGARALLGR